MREYITGTNKEKAILIGVTNNYHTEKDVNDYLKELAFLTETAGATPIKQYIQKLDIPNSRTYIGSGKLEEIKQLCPL